MLSITQIIANLCKSLPGLQLIVALRLFYCFDPYLRCNKPSTCPHIEQYWEFLGHLFPKFPTYILLTPPNIRALKKWGAGSNRDSSTATVIEPPWRSASTVGCRAASVASAQGPCVAPPIKQHKMMVIHGDTMAMRKVHKNAHYSKTM